MALVEVERRDAGVVVVRFNDPDRRNAMTVDMGQAMHRVFGELASDDAIRAVVVTGAPPAFSAGGDLEMLEDKARRAREEGFDATAEMQAFYRLFLSVRDLPVPAVAAVNGHAIGAGLCVALACDLTVVADDAKLGLNFAKLGLHPGMGGSWLLPRRVGTQRAAELLYTGRLISGAEAAAHGIALEATPADEVLPRALDLAADIAASSPAVVRQLRQTLPGTFDRTLDEQLRVEAASQAVNYASQDLVEGLGAVRDKRRPSF